jgi:hypothetical protein
MDIVENHMLSEAQEKRVWEGMLGSEIRAKYFADLSGRHLLRQQVAQWFTLLFASSNVFALLATLPADVAWIRLALAVCATATSVYLALANNNKKAFECANFHDRWGHLYQGYRELWEDTEQENASAVLKELDSRNHELSNASLSIPHNEKAMAKWQEHTEREHHLRAVV